MNNSRSAIKELFKWLFNLAVVHLLANIVYAMIYGYLSVQSLFTCSILYAYYDYLLGPLSP